MKVGLDRLPTAQILTRLRQSRLGVLAHPASVNGELRHIADVLAALELRPTMLFGPEHGYGGEAQDMVGVGDARDPRFGAPIVSLYGDTFASLSPTAAHFEEIDILLVDLADIGSRYYTFVWTALLAVRAAAKAGKHVILLDRPNPLGGASEQVEGRTPTDRRFLSFVGLEPVPVRHGLTIGEIVALFAEQDGLSLGADGALSILTMEGWDRDRGASAWDRPFVLPSPNMPTETTALVYPGGCLVEGTNLSEGRGLTRPFEIVGAPFVDGRALADDLARSGLPGFFARPLTFHAMFQKHARTISGGVQIHVTDPGVFQPFATYLALIGYVAQRHPDAFRFRTERYEFVDDIPAIDLLLGEAESRAAILAGDDPAAIARAAATIDRPAYDAQKATAARALARAAVSLASPPATIRGGRRLPANA
jgi:uncharacterized protein YbbC (DUF1343 family)